MSPNLYHEAKGTRYLNVQGKQRVTKVEVGKGYLVVQARQREPKVQRKAKGT